jgi:quercetin dioxygenase-like cupin family protein
MRGASRVSGTTKAPRNVIVRKKKRGPDAVCDAEDGPERLRDRRQNPIAALEEKDGTGRARAAHGAVAGAREKPVVVVVRKVERVRLPERPGARQVSYRFESLDFPATERKFNSYYAEFLPAAASELRPHTHPGVEFIYALTGTLSVHIGGEEHSLDAGDSMYFDSSVPHGYRRTGRHTCSALVVTTA